MMAAGLMLPLATFGQSDGFFRSDYGMGREDGSLELGGSNIETPSQGGGMSFSGATQENPTPVGCGLLIMVSAGAGYALYKKSKK